MSTSPAGPLTEKKPVRDCFALLGQLRQPWIDPEVLKTAFHHRSSELHPDRFHDRPETERHAAHDRYAEVNSAYQTLRDPKERLAHLLELERGVRPGNVQQVSGPAATLFFQVGELCREVDAFLSVRNKLGPPLLKAQSFAEGLDWTDRLQTLQGEIGKRRLALEEELKSLNSAWQIPPAVTKPGGNEGMAGRGPHLPLERLELIYRELSFITRWISQLNERLVRVSE